MSRTELNRLLEDARQQPLLLAELRRQLAEPEAVVRWAEENGYHLADSDVAVLVESDRELSDDELDEAAGGDWTPTPPPPPGSATGGGG